MVKTFLFSVLLLPFLVFAQQKIKNSTFHNGDDWKDTDGNFINAHGAGILKYKKTYYLFGEIKKGKTWFVPNQNWEDYRVPAGGVSCYSSKDLIHWKNESVALKPSAGNASSEIDTSKVIERPKVIYNEKTKKFVMWMHIDTNDYSLAHAGVAVSDKPTGPYKYLGSVKPNGQMCRDMTLFKDDDKKAYLIYTSENNSTMQICLLSDDYLTPTKQYIRILEHLNREGPAMFKQNGKYFLITSLCTGWDANAANYATADSVLGRWQQYGNPCIGDGANTTFNSQSTYVLPLNEKEGKFIFIADRWNKLNLEDSKYVWLPLQIKDGKPEIKMIDLK